jgi:hypothetical protein
LSQVRAAGIDKPRGGLKRTTADALLCAGLRRASSLKIEL